MIRLPVAERRFALALIVSAAIHAALLPMLLSFASGSAPRHVQPIRESCINAFLVPGPLAAAGKTVALPGRKRREADRAAPVAAAPPREVPEQVTPAEKEGKKMFADIRSPAEWPGMGHDAGALPAPASPASPVLVPGGGGLSGSNGAGITAARRGGGEFSGGNGAGVPASRREGTGETRQEGSGAWPPKDADAVPRYGDNARPAYPPLARLRGYQGVVVLFAEVLVDGRVGQVGIRHSSGHEILDRAALEAVRTWRFEPGRREGRAVTMSVEVPVRFVLNGNSAW
ncbi:MAG: energy transducer TonB [Proteobacteria bacterium]|nr:energy transducer TonB [Pseudomonadota bacterium]